MQFTITVSYKQQRRHKKVKRQAAVTSNQFYMCEKLTSLTAVTTSSDGAGLMENSMDQMI